MKRLIYALLALMLVLSSTGLAKKRIYFNTINKEIQSLSSTIPDNLKLGAISKAPATNNAIDNYSGGLPEYLVLTPQYAYHNTVSTACFRQADDSSYIYPAYDSTQPNKNYTLAALSYFPTTVDPNGPGITHGIAQFVPPLAGTFDIDTMYLDFYVFRNWKPFTKELYFMPIIYHKVNLGDSNAIKQVENTKNYMLFDINDDQSYTNLLPEVVRTITPDSINNRWEKDNNGNYTGSYRFLQLYFNPPLHVPQGQSLGVLIFNPDNLDLTKDSIVFPAHLEWGIPSRFYTYGYTINRHTANSSNDSVWLPYQYGYYGPDWNPGGSLRAKYPAMAGMPLMQDYDMTLFGIYDGPSSVEEESNIAAPFNLEQNTPNPADDNTTIKFSTFNNANVRLCVYNLTGELVSELINKPLTPGTYTATLNTSTLPSGAYIYNLRAGAFSTSKILNVVR